MHKCRKVLIVELGQNKPEKMSERYQAFIPEETHLGLTLDSGLTFHSHIKDKTIKANRGIGMIRYLSKYLTRDVLDQLYKLYVDQI